MRTHLGGRRGRILLINLRPQNVHAEKEIQPLFHPTNAPSLTGCHVRLTSLTKRLPCSGQPQFWQSQPPQPQPLVSPLTDNPMLFGAFPEVPSRFLLNRYKKVGVNFDSLYSTIIYESTTKPGFPIIVDDQSEHSAPSLSLVSNSVDERKGRIRKLSAWLRT